MSPEVFDSSLRLAMEYLCPRPFLFLFFSVLFWFGNEISEEPIIPMDTVFGKALLLAHAVVGIVATIAVILFAIIANNPIFWDVAFGLSVGAVLYLIHRLRKLHLR